MPRRLVLALHLATVLGLAGLVLLAFYSSEDASIGGAFLLMVLMGLGLPWSIWPALSLNVNGDVLSVAVYAGFTALNAVVVFAVLRLREQRGRADDPTDPVGC